MDAGAAVAVSAVGADHGGGSSAAGSAQPFVAAFGGDGGKLDGFSAVTVASDEHKQKGMRQREERREKCEIQEIQAEKLSNVKKRKGCSLGFRPIDTGKNAAHRV